MDFFINGTLATDLHDCYRPRNGYEKLVVQQLVAAAIELDALIAAAPDEPDARWMRLYALSDRVFQRNHRLLEKAGVYVQPTAAPQAAPPVHSRPNAPAAPTPAASDPARPNPPAPAPAGDATTSEWTRQVLKLSEHLTPEMLDQLAESENPLALVARWADQGLDPDAIDFLLRPRPARAA